MIGRMKEVTRNMDGTWNLTMTVQGDVRNVWAEYHDKELDVEIKRHRKKRSLDANAYAWVLINKIAEKMRIPPAVVYREAIRGVGNVSTVVCVQDIAVDALRRGWEAKGLGWQTDTLPSKLNGCTNVVLFYGSSTFDTRQMSQMIDNLIQDAKTLGIETMTPRELEAMLNA